MVYIYKDTWKKIYTLIYIKIHMHICMEYTYFHTSVWKILYMCKHTHIHTHTYVCRHTHTRKVHFSNIPQNNCPSWLFSFPFLLSLSPSFLPWSSSLPTNLSYPLFLLFLLSLIFPFFSFFLHPSSLLSFSYIPLTSSFLLFFLVFFFFLSFPVFTGRDF